MKKLIVIAIILVVLGLSLSGCFGPPKNSAGPKIAMTILPKEGDWSEDNYKQAVRLSKEGGASLANVAYQWGKLEHSYGDYSWADPDYDLSIYQEGRIKASVTIPVIDGEELGLVPLDIAGQTFDEQFIRRFENFTYKFLKRYHKNIDYLWIGSSVDNYLTQNPKETAGFSALLNRIQRLVHAAYPKISVGTIVAYQDAKSNNQLGLVNELAANVDIMGFSFYQTRGKRVFRGNASEAVKNLEEIIALNSAERIAIVETGWNTNPVAGGSKQLQRQYVKQLFKFLKSNEGRVEFLGFFALHDMPKSLVNEQVSHITGNLAEQAVLNNFMNSYGLFDVRGRAKPAWHEWLKQIKAYK
ncbi:MAG: hypothetical protein C4562_05625 [Actinobacteria bacterium]|nr:MAG: hypothetical protein C4562_05625 [Actinomycetota bacterium]